VIAISNLVCSFNFWIAAIVLVAAGIFAFKKFAATTAGRAQIDRIKLKLPIFGPIIYFSAIARLVRSLSLLVSSGLPLAQSIEVVKETALNSKISDALDWAKRRVEEGAPLGVSLEETETFPSFFVEMVTVGEESGTIVDMLDKVSVHYEEEFEFRLNRFLTILEPVLIIFVGGLVVFILLSIYLPIFKLWGGISGGG
jgi:type IV pilus assembly protein PilC